MTPYGTEFTQVDDGRFESFMAEQIGDRVGDEALRDAVERDAHAGTREGDAGGARFDVAEVHQLVGEFCGAARKVVDNIRAGPEVRFVEPPERLHRDVEGAFACPAEALALFDEGAEFAGWFIQRASGVEV